MGSVEVGRIFGIPIVLDGSFILLAVLFGFHHFTSGSIDGISYGIVLVAGVAFSILLHELGHALAARYYRVPTAYIELNGLGGLCHYARPMPPNRMANIVALLAGPAANLFLWQLFAITGNWLLANDPSRAAYILKHLSGINYTLFLFNLLPSHPLDGGRTLVQVLSLATGYDRAMRIVAYLGLMVTVWLGTLAISGASYAIIVAFVLFQTNMQVLQTHGGPRWKRWN